MEEIGASLKGAKGDPFHRGTFMSLIQQAQSAMGNIKNQMDKLVNEGKKDSDEYKDLQAQALSLAIQAQTLLTRTPGGQMSEVTDYEAIQNAVGGKSLGDEIDSDKTVDLMIDTLKRYYKYIKDNNIILMNQTLELENFFSNLGSALNTTQEVQYQNDDGETITRGPLTDNIKSKFGRVPLKFMKAFVSSILGENIAEQYFPQNDPEGESRILTAEEVQSYAEQIAEEGNEEFNAFVDDNPGDLIAAIKEKYGSKVLGEGLVDRIEDIQNTLAINFREGVKKLNEFIEDLKKEDPLSWTGFLLFDDTFIDPEVKTADDVAS